MEWIKRLNPGVDKYWLQLISGLNLDRGWLILDIPGSGMDLYSSSFPPLDLLGAWLFFSPDHLSIRIYRTGEKEQPQN